MSRSDILQSIRENRPAFSAPLVNVTERQSAIQVDLKEVFKKSLRQVGAEVVEIKEEELNTFLADNFTNLLDFDKEEVRNEYSADCSLDKLDKIENAILSGRLGVAENGAIWIEEADFSHRLVPFITQRLILRVNSSTIISNMQEAYRQIHLQDIGFGVFISGPSKTADIEQSLVYGAHGAKELTVLIIES